MSDFYLQPAQSRSPACLDIMGGISDFSGGLCLQWPLELATICRITPHEKSIIIARSDAATAAGWNNQVQLTLEELSAISPDNVRQKFAGKEEWALHVIGFLVILQCQIGWVPPCGMTLEIESNIPIGTGISSAAALEIAVLSALNRAFGLQMDGRAIAQWANRVKTQAVGAHADIRGQITALLGRKNHLLQLKCQPDIVEDFITSPDGIEFWGIASGVQNPSAAYDLARCATMMGRAILSRVVPSTMRGPDGELYLANISTDVWRALRNQIPEQMNGADFLRDYEEELDVDPNTIYSLRLATEHPIYEADRALRFADLLRQMSENPNARTALGRAAGELMIQSHFSYHHRCKLGNRETDLFVELAREAGIKNGIYGAKITGKGEGGTVALMCDRQINADLDAQIEEIAARYAGQSGQIAQIFRGSSDGANVLF